MSRPPKEDDPELDPLFGEEPPADHDGGRDARGFVPEFVRRVAVAGLGAVFMTEEGIRNLAGQLKLPKEVLGVVLSQAEKTKDDVGRVVSEEIRRFLQSEKLREEFVKLMAGMTVEIKAEVRLKPTVKEGEEPEPELVVTDIGTKRASRRKKE